jgi:hypothetical protein
LVASLEESDPIVYSDLIGRGTCDRDRPHILDFGKRIQEEIGPQVLDLDWDSIRKIDPVYCIGF